VLQKLNEKYDIVQIPMFKCCTCGKNVPEDSIILNNDRIFDCPHCNKIETPKIEKHYEKKIIEVYTTPKGAVIKNPKEYHGVKHRHQETITIEVN
jgi:ribosomal protein S26